MMSYFDIRELDCKCGCGTNHTKPELFALLNEARELAEIPFIINSGTRCEKHNSNVGGSKNSAHLRGHAADIKCEDSRSRFKIVKALLDAGFTRIEWGTPTWIHADCDPDKPEEVIFNP